MFSATHGDAGEILGLYCKMHGKWGMYLSFPLSPNNTELFQAAPILEKIHTMEAGFMVMFTGRAYILFSTKEEMVAAYNEIVGDDGSTKTNSYAGTVRVYAMTCDPSGKVQTENT